MFLFVGPLLSSLAKIGVNVTEQQKDVIKWRLSRKGQKHYTRKETNEFYRALKRGNMGVVGVTMKEQQRYLDMLKRDIGIRMIPILLCVLLVGCASTSEKLTVEALDESALALTEVSYKIGVDEEISVMSSKEPKRFSGDWYVIHADFIKKHKELIEDQIAMAKQIKAIAPYKPYFYGASGATIVLLIITVSLIKYK